MRVVKEVKGDIKKFERTKAGDSDLDNFLATEVEDAFSAQSGQIEVWRDCLRQYKAIPKTTTKKDPFDGAANIEIPLGAIAVETIAAQATDSIFNTSPLTTVRGVPGYEKHAKAFQTLTNHLMVDRFTNLRYTSNEAILDDVMLGTGALYTVWSKGIRQTGISEVQDRGARCWCVPTEDLVFPGGAMSDPEEARFLGYRTYVSQGEFEQLAKANEWNIDNCKPQKSQNISWLRVRREELARTRQASTEMGDQYELIYMYLYFDYMGIGTEQELFVTFDRVAQASLDVKFSPFDTRPFSLMRYQLQPHLAYGLGVLEMIRPFQDETTSWHNFRMNNARLANSRAWAYKIGSPVGGDRIKIVPNKAVGLASADDLKALAMADVYPSAIQYEAATIMLAERRTGINEMLNSGKGGNAGSRTPGMTTMALQAQVNKRFAPAVDGMKLGIADAIVQCLSRMKEKVLQDGADRHAVEDWLHKILSEDEAALVMEVMEDRDRTFEDCVEIEITASTAATNREAEKQSSLMLVNLLGQYYEKLLQLATVTQNPMTPEPIKALANRIAVASTEAMDRVVRTFDQVRDPKTFLISEDQFHGMDTGTSGLSGLGNAIGGLQGPPGQVPPANGGGPVMGGPPAMGGQG
jgi:hypothetical protein